ncbi:TonB-dependent receptor [Deminuibacter soli]|nr:TonB-dependent receptor [Deminuibacter soli]
MRITFQQIMIALLFTFTAFAHTSAQEVLQKKISVSFTETSLDKVIASIQAQTDVQFYYSSNTINARRKVTVQLSKERLADVLYKILQPLQIGYKVLNNKIVLYKSDNDSSAAPQPANLPESGFVFTPVRTKIIGTVVDDKDQPISGVSVMIMGTSTGVVTDVKGRFEITVNDKNNTVLVFKYTGYKEEEVPVNGREELSVKLQAVSKQLTDIVVIGFGEKKKGDVTSAVSTVGAKEISKSVAPSFEQAMQGRMTGVQVSSPGGSPYNRPVVRIRGVSTFGSGIADPLYVVDGVPLSEGYSGSDAQYGSRESDVRGRVNVLSMFNPGDIESISVLKDAAAAAVYGARAGNGVILITTKKGKSGKAKIEISTVTGISNAIKKYKLLNTQQYTALAQEAIANSGIKLDTDTLFDATHASYVGNKPTYDWQTPLLNKNALTQDYNLRVSGAFDGTDYYLSGGYNKTEGAYHLNDLERYSFAGNLNKKLGKYIATGVNYRGVYQKTNDSYYNDLFYSASASPWQPIYDASNKYGYAPTVDATFVPNPDYSSTGASLSAPYMFDRQQLLYGTQTHSNTFAEQQINASNYSMVRNFGNAYFQVEPITNLKIKASLGIDWYNNVRKNWTGFDSYLFSQAPQNPYLGGPNTRGQIGIVNSTNFNIVQDLSATYNKTFGKHNIDLLFDASYQKTSFSYNYTSSKQANSDDPKTRFILQNIDPRALSVETYQKDNAIIGYLGRISYNYNGKYYIDGTLRRDGSSRFAPENRWGTFPGVSAMWKISRESFMENSSFINDLSIRGSWGTVGNQEISNDYAFLSTISPYPFYSFGSGNGNGNGSVVNSVSLNDFPNRRLTWEKDETKDIGVNMLLFNKLTLSFDYYNKLTKGILQTTPLPLSVGNLNPALTNVCNVRNAGIEIEAAYNSYINKVHYNVFGNITTNKNTVTKTYSDLPVRKGLGGSNISVGKPVNYFLGYQVGGMLQSKKDVANYKTNVLSDDGFTSQNYQPGDYFFNDINHDGKISADSDLVYLGKPNPGYYYGFGFNADYKGFDVSVFFQGQGDVQLYNYEKQYLLNLTGNGSNSITTVLDRWTPDHTNTGITRATRGDEGGSNARYSNFYVENGAFLRLKNVQLGYTLQGKILKSATPFFNTIRLYVSGTNIFTITKYTGLDPEDAILQGAVFTPPVRTFTFGLNASF